MYFWQIFQRKGIEARTRARRRKTEEEDEGEEGGNYQRHENEELKRDLGAVVLGVDQD